MTPEERAKACLERHQDKGKNDSMLLPIDLEERIAAAIRAAVQEDRKASAAAPHADAW